jgi:hypothetical protein
MKFPRRSRKLGVTVCFKRNIVCSQERKYVAHVSHRSALEPDNNFVFGGINGGITINRTPINLLISNTYFEKYGPLLGTNR